MERKSYKPFGRESSAVPQAAASNSSFEFHASSLLSEITETPGLTPHFAPHIKGRERKQSSE